MQGEGADDRDPRRPGAARRSALVAGVLAAAIAFGAADQWIGGRYSPFLTAVSGMSAPWLLLPFLAGASQRARRPAAFLGLAATWLAVIAYIVMTDSPVEGAHLSVGQLQATAASQWPWFVGGLVAGPLYGLLGRWWRARRSWAAALVATVPVMLEPAAHWAASRADVYGWDPVPPANYAEVAVGLLLTAAVAIAIGRARRLPTPGQPGS
jgi:hypothetical protein